MLSDGVEYQQINLFSPSHGHDGIDMVPPFPLDYAIEPTASGTM